jgi:hypothetical protein
MRVHQILKALHMIEESHKIGICTHYSFFTHECHCHLPPFSLEGYELEQSVYVAAGYQLLYLLSKSVQRQKPDESLSKDSLEVMCWPMEVLIDQCVSNFLLGLRGTTIYEG